MVPLLVGTVIGFLFGCLLAWWKNDSGQSISSEDDKPVSCPAELTFSDDVSAYKMVFVVRQDLKMGKGKAAAQCCHAAMAVGDAAQINHPEWYASWASESYA